MPQASEDESAGNYAFALWNLIIRPPRRKYTVSDLGPKEFRLGSVKVRRTDIDLPNGRGLTLKCSHFEPKTRTTAGPAPCVVYLHGNASCRVEALQYVTLLLPLEITLFCFDFAGCGISDGEYVSLGWHERDDLATVMQYLREKEVGAIGLWCVVLCLTPCAVQGACCESCSVLIWFPWVSISCWVSPVVRGVLAGATIHGEVRMGGGQPFPQPIGIEPFQLREIHFSCSSLLSRNAHNREGVLGTSKSGQRFAVLWVGGDQWAR
mmetsp:Transcript_21813/g.55723  ORF Transcript_21813/g.55723 Transcript_21813/m.55723 type:complete len:265 (-) Transcript_21813:1257-2051(-)